MAFARTTKNPDLTGFSVHALEGGAWKEAHLAIIARPQQPVGSLFSALRSSPVRQCMLAALHMSIHACTLRMCRFTPAKAICRASRTFSAWIRFLATRLLGVTAFRTCMARIMHAPAASS
jgi:hypothetical protein